VRLLVTGASGFVGTHVDAALPAICGPDLEILRTAREAEPGRDVLALDMTDVAALRALLRAERPTHVLNLAGLAQPAEAASREDAAWSLHADALRHLGGLLLEEAPGAVLVNAGSGLVYGGTFSAGGAVGENAPLDPLDAYAASKAAGDLALGVLARRGLRCVRFRPFNHTGPGQSEGFVIAAFAAQIARIEAGLEEPVLRVGNLEAERDFVDVRDVVRAYGLALLHSGILPPGTVLNVASGVPRRIADILDALRGMSRVPIAVRTDPARMRASDVPRAVGDADRLQALLGWVPRIPFEQTLADVLADWRARVRAA
jgi:GDP-4-dehydro-6-deoxy-D-mannose reductase